MVDRSTEDFYQSSLDYLHKSVERGRNQIKQSRVIALGGGALCGSGLFLAVDGHPVLGTIAAVVGAGISWQMTDDILQEQKYMIQDMGYIEDYEERLLQVRNEDSKG